jgi:hypothetical protein
MFEDPVHGEHQTRQVRGLDRGPGDGPRRARARARLHGGEYDGQFSGDGTGVFGGATVQSRGPGWEIFQKTDRAVTVQYTDGCITCPPKLWGHPD